LNGYSQPIPNVIGSVDEVESALARGACEFRERCHVPIRGVSVVQALDRLGGAGGLEVGEWEETHAVGHSRAAEKQGGHRTAD
jgi:hypothetical protein